MSKSYVRDHELKIMFVIFIRDILPLRYFTFLFLLSCQVQYREVVQYSIFTLS